MPTGQKTLGANLMQIEALLDTTEHIATHQRAARSVVLITWSLGQMPAGYQDLEEVVCKFCLPLSPSVLAHPLTRSRPRPFPVDLFKLLHRLKIAVVMSAGNCRGWTDYHTPQRVTRLPQRLVNDPAVPDLIVVGASNKMSRKAVFSMETDDMVWAPGEELLTVGSSGYLEELDGTSYSGALVAGLVAYYRGVMFDMGLDDLDSPQEVKWLLKGLSRTVQLYHREQPPGPTQDGEGTRFSHLVPTVWNGQLDGDVSCIRTPEDTGCPDFVVGQKSSIDGLDNECAATSITKRKRRLGRRQSAGSCPVIPGGGAGSGGDGGSNGDDGGLNDKLGPPQTVTYHNGPPSPTCTANCGTYCTDFWCRPDRTGQPPFFTDPAHLPATALPPIIPNTTTPGASGDVDGSTTSQRAPDISTGPPPPLSTASWPTNCASTATWTRCAATGGGNIICVATSSCAATSAPAPPQPTQPTTHKGVAIHFVELTTNTGMSLSWSRYWSVHEDPSHDGGTQRYNGFCNRNSVFEKVDGGASLQSPGYPVDLGSFKAHGRTCRYKSAGRGAAGRVECDGVKEEWSGGCVDVKKLSDPIFGEVRACAPLSNPMYKLVLGCSWGEA